MKKWIAALLLFASLSFAGGTNETVLKGAVIVNPNSPTQQIVVPTVAGTMLLDSQAVLTSDLLPNVPFSLNLGSESVPWNDVVSSTFEVCNTSQDKCIYITAPNPSGSYFITLPNTQGANQTFMTNDGNGNLSWSTLLSILGYTPVNKAGDTMTGALILSGDPTTALGAATKQYVDTGDATNASAISSETSRAEGAESANAAAISTETSRAEGVEATNASAISTETTRAESAESMLLPLNGSQPMTGALQANAGVTLGAGSQRQTLWIANTGDCNHALYSNSQQPCGYDYSSLPGITPNNNDGEVIDYNVFLAFQARDVGSAVSYFGSNGDFYLGGSVINSGLQINNPNRTYVMGDIPGAGNNTQLSIIDSANEIIAGGNLNVEGSHTIVDNLNSTSIDTNNRSLQSSGTVLSWGSGLSALTALNMNSNPINNVTDPTNAQDAATKNYVDTHSGGGSPGGSTNSIQTNNGSGGFGGDANLTYAPNHLNFNQTVDATPLSDGPFLINENGTDRFSIGADATNGLVYMQSWSNSALSINAGGNNVLILPPPGNGFGSVGIGTASPSQFLDVNGAATFENNQIHSVSDPTSTQDVATKNYVDTHVFVSTVQTGNSSQQSIPHGLGVTPTRVIVTVYDNSASSTYSIVEGSHDATNVYVTVTSGVTYKVWASP